jgi:predicted RNA-binding protein YlqC (UPF0109 family)
VKQLVEYVVRGLVTHPEAVSVNTVDGESSVLLELSVDPADIASVQGPEGATLQAIRTVLSASAGRRKAVLELVEPGQVRDANWETPEDERTEEVVRASDEA